MDVAFPVPDTPADQLVCDILGALSAEIGVKHPADDLRLLRHDLQVSPIYQPVAVGRFCGDELAPLHPPAIALVDILGDGHGLLLGQGTGNAHHQFCGERSGVDILFFKLDGHAQPHQLPQGGETVLGIP